MKVRSAGVECLPLSLTLDVVEPESVFDVFEGSGDFRKQRPFSDSNHRRLRGRVNLCVSERKSM